MVDRTSGLQMASKQHKSPSLKGVFAEIPEKCMFVIVEKNSFQRKASKLFEKGKIVVCKKKNVLKSAIEINFNSSDFV